MLHVTNGDATRVKLERAGLPGEISVWADALHDGPVPAGADVAALRELRARHFADSDEDAGNMLRMVERWDADLASFPAREEVVFWFEHDLFDQLILIRHLHWLTTIDRGSTKFSLICIGSFPGVERFIGLGPLTPQQLATLFPSREPITEAQFALGREAWTRFREPDPRGFAALLRADTSPLPFLAGAIRRHLEDFPSAADGLSRTERQMLQAIDAGVTRFPQIFRACQEREERVYMGDVTFRRILLELAHAAQPLLSMMPGEEFILTTTGREVLAGRADHVALNGIDRWMGGVHLTADNVWRREELLRGA